VNLLLRKKKECREGREKERREGGEGRGVDYRVYL